MVVWRARQPFGRTVDYVVISMGGGRPQFVVRQSQLKAGVAGGMDLRRGRFRWWTLSSTRWRPRRYDFTARDIDTFHRFPILIQVSFEPQTTIQLHYPPQRPAQTLLKRLTEPKEPTTPF